MPSVTIIHQITKRGVFTTLRMPGRKQIKKAWLRQSDGSFMMNDCNGWEDEDLPEDIVREVDRSPTSICEFFDE